MDTADTTVIAPPRRGRPPKPRKPKRRTRQPEPLPKPPDGLYSVAEGARALGITPAALYLASTRGRIAFTDAHGIHFIQADEVERYRQAHEAWKAMLAQRGQQMRDAPPPTDPTTGRFVKRKAS